LATSPSRAPRSASGTSRTPAADPACGRASLVPTSVIRRRRGHRLARSARFRLAEQSTTAPAASNNRDQPQPAAQPTAQPLGHPAGLAPRRGASGGHRRAPAFDPCRPCRKQPARPGRNTAWPVRACQTTKEKQCALLPGGGRSRSCLAWRL
jgi:hypothetical protein